MPRIPMGGSELELTKAEKELAEKLADSGPSVAAAEVWVLEIVTKAWNDGRGLV